MRPAWAVVAAALVVVGAVVALRALGSEPVETTAAEVPGPTSVSTSLPSGDAPPPGAALVPPRGSDSAALIPSDEGATAVPAAEATTSAPPAPVAPSETTAAPAPTTAPAGATAPTATVAPPVAAPPPAVNAERVVVPSNISELFVWSEPIDAALAVLRASGPLPSVVASHPEIHANLAHAFGGYVPNVAEFSAGIAEAYERTLVAIIDEEADVDAGLCVVTGVIGDQVRCTQVPELWATPSVNTMRSAALARIAASLSGQNQAEVEALVDSNFSGGTLWAVMRAANASFLAAELRHGWAAQGIQVRTSDRHVAGHLLFLSVYAAESQAAGAQEWSLVAQPQIQIAYGVVWNQGRDGLWSRDGELKALVWGHPTTVVGDLSLGTAKLTAPY